jgi:hypothetical protein
MNGTDEKIAPPTLAEMPADLREIYMVAQILARSGMFADATTVSKAVAKMLAGRELGMAPIASLTNIHVVKDGRIQVGAVILGALVQRSGQWDYEADVVTADRVELSFYRLDSAGVRIPESRKVSTFTQDDAKRAGTGSSGTLAKFPRNMLFARALSNGVKWFCPALLGGMALYTEGELDDVDTDVADEPPPVAMPRRLSAPEPDLTPHLPDVALVVPEDGRQPVALEANAEPAPPVVDVPADDEPPPAAVDGKLVAAGWTWNQKTKKWKDPETGGTWPLVTALNILDARTDHK